MAQVFLSYARKDASELARRLRADVEKAGHSVWVDVARVGGGDLWTLEIERAIRNCPVMLVCISEGYVDSPVCLDELQYAIAHHKRLIPVLVQEGIELPLPLIRTNYRDFSDPLRYEQELDLLLADLVRISRETAVEETGAGGQPRRRHSVYRRLVDVAYGIRANAFPAVLSAWMAAVFAERVVADRMIWTRDLRLAAALGEPSVHLVFLLCWLLILASLLVGVEQVGAWQARLWRLGSEVAAQKGAAWVLVSSPIGLLILVFLYGALSGRAYSSIFEQWWQTTKMFAVRMTIPGAIAAKLALGYAIIRIAYRMLRGHGDVNKAALEWVTGSFFNYAAWVFYAAVYYLVVWPLVVREAQLHFALGFLVNSLTYTFLAAFLVNAMYRFGNCVYLLKGQSKWNAFAVFAGFAAVLAIVMLALDGLNARDVVHGLNREYPYAWQWRIAFAHILIRDWVMLVPLVFVVFTWLFRKVIRAAADEAAALVGDHSLHSAAQPDPGYRA